MEMGGKIEPETAFQNVKMEVKELKRLRKLGK